MGQKAESVRVMVPPGHTAGDAGLTIAPGRVSTDTSKRYFAAVQVDPVAVNVYIPAAVGVTVAMVGLRSVELNPLGPAHEYVVAVPAPELSCKVVPEHIGPLSPPPL